MFSKRKVVLVFLFCLALIIRLYDYPKQPVIPDEFKAYSEYAFSLLANDWEWTHYWMLINPPLFPYMLAAMTYFLGDGGLTTLRIVPIIFGSLTVCTVYLLGERLYNSKVGLLSALTLAFYSYHIFYSRAVMLEAPVIFFMLTSVYFFYRCYDEDKNKYAVLAGVFLGLALITKYIGLFLYVVFFLTVVWTKERNIDSIKKLLMAFLVSILVASPVLIVLYQNGVNPIEVQILQSESSLENPAMPKMGIVKTIENGLNKIMLVLTDGESKATQMLPSDWIGIYKISSVLIFLTVILFYLYLIINESKFNDRLIFMYFIVFGFFMVLYRKKHDYYFLWDFSIYFIMMSMVFYKFLSDLKQSGRRFSVKNIVKLTFIFLVLIFSISYFVTGIKAPEVNEGDEAGHKTQIENIIPKIEQGESIASNYPPVTYYYINNYFYKNVDRTKFRDVAVYSLYTQKTDPYPRKGLDIQLIEDFWPKYLITDYLAFKYFTDGNERFFIEKNYLLISNENDVLLYERKGQHIVSNTTLSTSETSASIDRNLLYTSAPRLMVVGEGYKLKVRITNHGQSFGNFLVKFSAPFGTIYPYEDYEIIQLGQGGSKMVEFALTPTRREYMPTNITVSLFLIRSKVQEQSSLMKLDEVTHQIIGIKKAY